MMGGGVVSCDQGGGLPSLSPACPAFCFDFAPYPPDPLPRRGRGSFFVYFAGGFAPGTPAAEPARRLLALPLWYPAGGVPPALPARRALAVPCGGLPSLSPAYPAFSLLSFPHPPYPLPGGKGVILGYFMQGASPPAPLAAEPERRLLALPLWYPAEGVPRRCRRGGRWRYPAGACLLCRPPTPPLVCFLSPIPPAPFPSGEGGDFRLFHARGFAPCIPEG